ncbi:MAG: hypothetical protein J6I56_07245 [Lachnospiraceae bacterium]|nr:hypothetical protein [Lachnospiraceae bacterium]
MSSKNRLIKYILLLAAAAAACFLLAPWYRSYVENDHAKTCRKARIQLILQYRAALEEAGVPRNSGSDSVIEAALSSCMDEPFPEGTSLSAEGDSYIIKGPCLSGGTYHVLVDKNDPYDILITCDHDGHGQVSLDP